MITLEGDELVFRFPDLHPAAECRVQLQRTLRVPDDDREYPLPPGLGRFPMRHLEDYAARLDPTMASRGGVIVPMWQAEALWIAFSPPWMKHDTYPFALRIATGKIDAVTGARWAPGLDGARQNYVVVPGQPWLDGYCVARGVIRQFVAMPLGEGYTAEEQITGAAEYGGIQIQAFPMKPERYRLLSERSSRWICDLAAPTAAPSSSRLARVAASAMGIAPGGRMRQHLYEDEYGIDAWDLTTTSRCFVTILNSADWHATTGEAPPTPASEREGVQPGGVALVQLLRRGEDTAPGGRRARRAQECAHAGEGKGRGAAAGERARGASGPDRARSGAAAGPRSQPLARTHRVMMARDSQEAPMVRVTPWLRALLIFVFASGFGAGAQAPAPAPAGKPGPPVAVATAAPSSVGVDPARLERLHRGMQALVDRHEVGGIVTLIARDGKVVDVHATGFQDVESRTPMQHRHDLPDRVDDQAGHERRGDDAATKKESSC